MNNKLWDSKNKSAYKGFMLGEELKHQIEKLDKFVKNYKMSSRTFQLPSSAYMNWGIELARSGNVVEGMEKLNTAALMANKNPWVFVNLGIAFLKQKKYEEAIKNFRKAVKIDKYNSRAYAMWAAALSEIGDLKGAVDIYKIAEKYDSRDPDIYLNWGVSLARAGNKTEAEEKFKKSVLLNPVNPIPPFLWGLILLEHEDYKEAINKFKHSLIYSDKKYDCLYYIALCFVKLQDYNNAKEYALSALAEDKSQIDPYMVLADCYLNMCLETKCLDVFKEAEQNAQTNVQFYLNWGLALQRYNYVDDAREKFYTALILEPNNELLLFNLGVNFMLSKEFTQAEEFFNKVLTFNPKHPQSLCNLAAIAYDAQNYDKALHLYKEAYNNDKKNYVLFFYIANCYYKKSDFENAAFYFKKCNEYCPKHVQAYVNFANMLVEIGNEQEALRKIRSAYLLDKQSAYLNFVFGVINLKLALFDDAIDKLQKSVNIDANYNIAYLALAEAYLYKNKPDESLNILDNINSDYKSSKEFLNVQEKILCSVVQNEESSQSVLNHVYQYCNKFLEQYNNDKVLEIKEILLNKDEFEAN